MQDFICYKRIFINMSNSMAEWLSDSVNDLVDDDMFDEYVEGMSFAMTVVLAINRELTNPAFYDGVPDRITVELDERTAVSLFQLMQNDLFDDETHKESDNRCALFYELKKHVYDGDGLVLPNRGTGEDVPF